MLSNVKQSGKSADSAEVTDLRGLSYKKDLSFSTNTDPHIKGKNAELTNLKGSNYKKNSSPVTSTRPPSKSQTSPNNTRSSKTSGSLLSISTNFMSSIASNSSASNRKASSPNYPSSSTTPLTRSLSRYGSSLPGTVPESKGSGWFAHYFSSYINYFSGSGSGSGGSGSKKTSIDEGVGGVRKSYQGGTGSIAATSLTDPKTLSRTVRHLIKEKRESRQLSDRDYKCLVDGTVAGTIHPGQIGALLMAIRMKGMSYEETLSLTYAMLEGCREITWPHDWENIIVDKHSTMGGLGDKVTLILVPALAACGLKVPKITRPNFESLLGVYSINNTIKKLESIPGFSVNCGSVRRILEILDVVGCCIFTPQEPFTLAGPILDTFKDITATNDCIPLMAGHFILAASIMSEKKAENISSLVLDVKYGPGSPCKTKDQAIELGNLCVKLGHELGIKVRAILTIMGKPLGQGIGDALEVSEAINTIRGNGPEDLTGVVCELGGNLLASCGKTNTATEGGNRLRASLKDGTALLKFKEMLMIQGVDENFVNKLTDPEQETYRVLRFGKLPLITYLQVSDTGYIHHINAYTLASVCYEMASKSSGEKEQTNHGMGMQIIVHIGDHVDAGDSWVKVYHDTVSLSPRHMDMITSSISIMPDPLDPEVTKVVTDIIL